jgi:hypothetical protein
MEVPQWILDWNLYIGQFFGWLGATWLWLHTEGRWIGLLLYAALIILIRIWPQPKPPVPVITATFYPALPAPGETPESRMKRQEEEWRRWDEEKAKVKKARKPHNKGCLIELVIFVAMMSNLLGGVIELFRR